MFPPLNFCFNGINYMFFHLCLDLFFFYANLNCSIIFSKSVPHIKNEERRAHQKKWNCFIYTAVSRQKKKSFICRGLCIIVACFTKRKVTKDERIFNLLLSNRFTEILIHLVFVYKMLSVTLNNYIWV